MSTEDETQRAMSCREFNQEERVSRLSWGQKGREILQLDLQALRRILCHPKSIAKPGKREGSPNLRRGESKGIFLDTPPRRPGHLL